MASGSSIFNGANTTVSSGSSTAPAKKSFHNHTDSAINSLAKSGGLVGMGKKVVKSLTPTKSSSGSASLGESSSTPTTVANLEY
jgi:hypothetical protein